jgi:hypothetical protein
MGEKKITKKREGNRRHHLKKTDPMGSNVYLSAYLNQEEKKIKLSVCPSERQIPDLAKFIVSSNR